MTTKPLNLKKLRSQVDDFSVRLSLRSSSPHKSPEIDEELHSALRTRPKRTQNKSYDKDLLTKAKQEIEMITKELNKTTSSDDLCLSSGSENSKLSSSFRITKSSAFSLSKLPKPKAPDSETARLQRIIDEKDKKIEMLESKLLESQKLSEKTKKKLLKTTKALKESERDISSFKKACDQKLEEYKVSVTKLEQENKELNTRIRSAENDRDHYKEKSISFKSKLSSIDEMKKNNQDLKKKFDDSLKLIETLQSRYESLMQSSMAFEEKTRDLYKANQILQENMLKLLPES